MDVQQILDCSNVPTLTSDRKRLGGAAGARVYPGPQPSIAGTTKIPVHAELGMSTDLGGSRNSQKPSCGLKRWRSCFEPLSRKAEPWEKSRSLGGGGYAVRGNEFRTCSKSFSLLS